MHVFYYSGLIVTFFLQQETTGSPTPSVHLDTQSRELSYLSEPLTRYSRELTRLAELFTD